MKVVLMCFRDADGAGHAHGSTEPHVYHELDGALHKTGHLLAAAGQPEGKVTNGLLSTTSAKHTTTVLLVLLLAFTSPQRDNNLKCPSGLCLPFFSHVTWASLQQMIHRCHLMFVFTKVRV